MCRIIMNLRCVCGVFTAYLLCFHNELTTRHCQMKQKILHFVVLVLSVYLSACAVSTRVDSADDVKATQAGNIVLIGYRIALPNNDIQSVSFLCKEKQTGKLRNCFKMPVKLGHRQLHGAGVFRMKYGHYELTDMVLTEYDGMRLRYQCYTQTNGKQKCQPYSEQIYNDIQIETGFTQEFVVTPEKGVYLGQVNIALERKKVKATGINVKAAKAEFSAPQMLQRYQQDIESLEDVNLRETIKAYLQ